MRASVRFAESRAKGNLLIAGLVETDPARLRPSDVQVLLGDASKFKKATGWEPKIPFEQTLEDMLAYWRER
jgi:GDP-4-dehydro-6-deoxy-D-mannose reductase